jgi:type VI secretion system protein ImpH
MDAVSGPATDDLIALLADVAPQADRWELFALARGIEQARPAAPRIGTALDPADELVDWAHEPSLNFPRTTVARFEDGPRRPRVRSQHLGLTGPMGPLPLHMAEIALAERRVPGPQPYGDFLDLLSARMLQAFYRAWSQSEPCAQADRPADDGFATILGAVSGAADLRFAGATDRDHPAGDRFDDWRRLAYGGHLQGLRSASAVADVLAHLLGRPVTVEEAVGRWRAIPLDARSRIGARRGAHAQLGQGATLGERFFAVEWDVAINVTARDAAELDTLLPGGDANRLLVEAATAVLPPSLDWTIRVEIAEAAAPAARLGRTGETGTPPGTRLGLTGWMAPRGGQRRPRRDVRLDGRKWTARSSDRATHRTSGRGDLA